MTDEYKFRNTGDEIARIDFGGVAELVIKDDGFDDSDVNKHFEFPDGECTNYFSSFRRRVGDETFAEALENAGGSTSGATSLGASSFDRNSPSFKCSGCNQTWPRTKNQNDGAGDDICPECAD